MHGSTIAGPTFIRLLARLIRADIAPTGQSLSDRLSQWFEWTHALALSTALDGRPAAAASDRSIFGGTAEDEYARVRVLLTNTISADAAFPNQDKRGQTIADDDAATSAFDFTVFRQRYIAMQRSMQAATGSLRGRLREVLAQKSDRMAQLAEVDAAMELTLSPREQTLLASVPDLLGEHFERLRQAEQSELSDAQESVNTPAAMPGAWLGVFRRDMQSILLAELDVRFQPIEGLLAALRSSPMESHVQKFA